jgi:hypothetical protein
MTRQRNPRRIALAVLRNIKRNVSVMVSTWDQDMTTWERPHDAGPGVNGTWRKLRDDEKHENSPEEWNRLVMFMDSVIRDAEAVRRHAVEQARLAHELDERRCQQVAACGCALEWIETTGHQEGCTAPWRDQACRRLGDGGGRPSGHHAHLLADSSECVA